MTCSLALDHRVHLPPLCLANKAKTDVAASVGFGVDGCYTERVSSAFPGRWLWHHPAGPRALGSGAKITLPLWDWVLHWCPVSYRQLHKKHVGKREIN